MAVYNLSSPVQPLAVEKNLVKEVLKSQPNMDIVIIELKNIVRDTRDNNADMEGFIRTITDYMPLSLNKKEAVDNTLEYYKKTGAAKYTDVLSAYIDENYEIEDHRGERNYESWDEEYKSLMTDINKRKKH